MDLESVSAIMKALEGLTYLEWTQIRDIIDQEFAAERDKVRFLRQNGQEARRLIAIANEWPHETAEPSQTRMGF